MRTSHMLALMVALGCVTAMRVEAATIDVNCSKGQTIGAALASLDRHRPNTVNVRGTCIERVDIHGFESLTLLREADRGDRRAPSRKRRGTLAGLQIQERSRARPHGAGEVGGGLHGQLRECRVQGSTIEGLTILGAMNSVLFLKNVLHGNDGFAAFAAFDNSTAQIVDCSFDPGTGSPWWGVAAFKGSVVSIGGSSIRGFGIGIGVSGGAHLSLEPISVPGSDPETAVLVENSWFRGIDVTAGSTAYISSIARLHGNGEAGRAGIMAGDGSQVEIIGARIVDTRGNGLVVVNNSTATAHPAFPDLGSRVEITGSGAQDIFCDATSVVSGTDQITGATKITCPNLNPGRQFRSRSRVGRPVGSLAHRAGPRPLDVGESAEGEPAGESADERFGPLDPDEPGAHRVGEPYVPHPGLRQREKVGIDDQIDLVARVLQAHVHVPGSRMSQYVAGRRKVFGTARKSNWTTTRRSGRRSVFTRRWMSHIKRPGRGRRR